MAPFAVEHLSGGQLADAWPVVQRSGSHANADWWISEATALIERGGGVLAARALDASIHGVATYQIARKARLGRVLAVDTLVTFELSRRAPVRQSLCEALELLANAFDCRCIVLPLPSRGHVAHRAKSIFGLLDSEASRAD